MDPSINWSLFVIIGFVAGVTGKDRRAGKVGTIIVGIIGACVGGSLLGWSRFLRSVLFRMGWIEYDLIVSLLMATAGALFLLFLLRMVKDS
jgi:uncharacterized membrane protein YeaQ/YmgE (transglycosylase-associated protein family)